MRKLLLLLMLPLLLAASPVSRLHGSIFKVVTMTADGLEYGTGFCSPGKTNIIQTASHVVGDGSVAIDSNGKPHSVKVLMNDHKADIALLMLDDAACELSPMIYAAKDAEPGDDAYLIGWGGGFERTVTTRGVISSEKAFDKDNHALQLAQLNALFGHSGSPVVGSDGKIIGMLVGLYDDKGDELDVIVPVSSLKKALK